jgi:hypothetical protein
MSARQAAADALRWRLFWLLKQAVGFVALQTSRERSRHYIELLKQPAMKADSCSPLAWDVQVNNFALVVLHLDITRNEVLPGEERACQASVRAQSSRPIE